MGKTHVEVRIQAELIERADIAATLTNKNRTEIVIETLRTFLDDHERLETELLAQDRDAARVSTADVDETTARQLVGALVDDGVVTAVAEQRVLVHEPSGEAFRSISQLAIFHRGWLAARDSGEETD